MQFELNAQGRTLQGSGASRRLRRANMVPGIIYGGNVEPTLIEIPHNDLLLALRKQGFHSTLITLKVGSETESVLLRDSQMHPYKPLVLHVDFMRVDTTRVVHQKVPLHLINADIAPGVKVSGGFVTTTMTEVEVACLPKDLPAFIEVDLKDLKGGQTIHVSQLNFPANVKPVLHGSDDPLVVTITLKRMAAEAEEGEAAAAAPAAPAAGA